MSFCVIDVLLQQSENLWDFLTAAAESCSPRSLAGIVSVHSSKGLAEVKTHGRGLAHHLASEL